MKRPPFASMSRASISNRVAALTTGDVDGIGLEVALKALEKLKPKSGQKILLFYSSKEKIKRVGHWPLVPCKSALSIAANRSGELYLIGRSDPPTFWVVDAINLCLDGVVDTLVTGPLSKTSIRNAGFKDLGHTEILKRMTQSPHVKMAFLGRRFKVLLHSDHIPISKVPSAISPSSLKVTLKQALAWRSLMGSRQPIGVLGLNPHAGESGLIGNEEITALESALSSFSKDDFQGPLSPDGAFHEKNFKKFFCFVALYHDQGLIPFKALHGQSDGIHISLGLPFLRVSVDHGTAQDIFSQGIADEGSMVEALKWGLSWCKEWKDNGHHQIK